MIILRTIKIVAYAALLSFCSSALLAGDIGVEGSVTATTFVGDGAGLTGVNPKGVEIGDMQYWDGTEWNLIPAPPVDGSYALITEAGVPHWTPVRYTIGDWGPAGGIVFYITDGGQHGLEAPPADQYSSEGWEWGCFGTDISGAEEPAVGTGAQNTADILAGCGDRGIAARVAVGYEQNGFTDWFLPSKDELNLLYQQKDVVGGFASYYYWSSSEHDIGNAWAQYFNNGSQFTNYKTYTNRVRAVRAF